MRSAKISCAFRNFEQQIIAFDSQREGPKVRCPAGLPRNLAADEVKNRAVHGTDNASVGDFAILEAAARVRTYRLDRAKPAVGPRDD